MKLVGIVGSNAEQSYNRLLLKYIATHFAEIVDVEVLEIRDVPMFSQDDDQSANPAIQYLNRKIMAADGVIIATPEHNHTIPASLKNTLEWLSYQLHPLDGKPVMIVGASYYDQGSSRAQLHLRQVLDAPGVNAVVMPGNEFLLGTVKEAFDDAHNLKDADTVAFLQTCLGKFLQFVKVTQAMNQPQPEELPTEDLTASGSIDTTIEGIDKEAEDWVEQAAAKVSAISGNQYVQLDRGILTVDQLNALLASLPMEITYADSNNQSLYYNLNRQPADEMFAPRQPGQAGNPLAKCHPKAAQKHVEWVIQQLRAGKQDVVRMHVPKHGDDQFVVHNYQALHATDGQYMGINEYILDFKPIVDWYLAQTGQTLAGGQVDAVSSASKTQSAPAASAEPTMPVVDAVSSASKKS